MIINGNIPLKFKPTELQCLNWFYSIAPCFAVNASKINIITDPRKYYDTLCERFKNAQRRISVASLYVGTGPMERNLFKLTKESVQSKKLKFRALLDFQRGTRGEVNSRTMLQEFIDEMPEQCSLFMYQTPRLYGPWSKALPSRYNEIVGLQHMKLYIADDSVLLSGANCSNDYFQKRQDRYVEIQDADLADFYSELIDEVSSFSKKCLSGGDSIEELPLPREVVTTQVSARITEFIEDWTIRQQSKPQSDTSDKDTWIFPLIQMGEFNINQDEQATLRFLSSAPKGSYIRLATGYFNLTEQYAKALLKGCSANISLLMAHPNANGFLGASGPAGGIPHAYSLIAQKFWDKVQDSNQASRVQILEYERAGWTFHAKGLWYYPPGSCVPWGTIVGSANLGERSVRRDLEAQAAIFTTSPQLQSWPSVETMGKTSQHGPAVDCNRLMMAEGSGVPWGTIVGSANLGERSVRRDLEAQAAIFTTSPQLQEKLQDECAKLHQYASECSSELQKRQVPLWVRATVGLFRTYF